MTARSRPGRHLPVADPPGGPFPRAPEILSTGDAMNPSATPARARPGLAVLVALARLRFLVILGVIGLAITKRDLLVAWYEKATRPAEAPDAATTDVEYYCPMH